MITFSPLSKQDFPLLLKWLEADHVKAGWPEDEAWTLKRIQEKYSSYVQSYKLNAEGKPR